MLRCMCVKRHDPERRLAAMLRLTWLSIKCTYLCSCLSRFLACSFAAKSRPMASQRLMWSPECRHGTEMTVC